MTIFTKLNIYYRGLRKHLGRHMLVSGESGDHKSRNCKGINNGGDMSLIPQFIVALNLTTRNIFFNRAEH